MIEEWAKATYPKEWKALEAMGQTTIDGGFVKKFLIKLQWKAQSWFVSKGTGDLTTPELHATLFGKDWLFITYWAKNPCNLYDIPPHVDGLVLTRILR